MVETVEIELTIHLQNHRIPGMEGKNPQGLDFYYKVDPAYRLIAANSILSTITPDGQAKIDFCVESLAIPDRLTFPPGESTKLLTPIASDPEPRTQRYVQCGVLLTVDQAEIIGNLILQIVEQIRTTQAKMKNL